jgi:hypothetical protein
VLFVLFLIYINDIQEFEWKTYLTLYADDIFMLSIHNESNYMIKNLQHDFDTINRYLDQNDLYISVEKTCFMHIKTSHMECENEANIKIIAHETNCVHPDICFCKSISKVKDARYLGIDLDSNWKFYTHIDNLINRLRKVIPVFYQIRNLLNDRNKRQLFESLVMSISRYACCIYGTTSQGLVERVQKIHNKAVKVLFNDGYSNKNSATIFAEQKILTFKQMIIYTILTQNYHKPDYKNLIKRPIRNNHNWLIEPVWRNSYGKRNFEYLIPHTFNLLPEELRKIVHKQKVNKGIKHWLLNSNNINM